MENKDGIQLWLKKQKVSILILVGVVAVVALFGLVVRVMIWIGPPAFAIAGLLAVAYLVLRQRT